MGFPVTLNGRVFTVSDFDGTGYVNALPDSIEAAGDEYRKNAHGSSTTSLTIGTGAKAFTTQAGLSWTPGVTTLRIATSDANYMDGLLTAYDAVTGAASVTVSVVAGSGTYSSWSITGTLAGPHVPISWNVGGTGMLTFSLEDMRNGLQGFTPKQGMAIYDDFVGFFDFQSFVPEISNKLIGPWNVNYRDQFYEAQILSPNPLAAGAATDCYGTRKLSVASQGSAISMTYGNGGFMSVSEGGDFLFVTSVRSTEARIPGQLFVARIGLRGFGSSINDNIFDSCGIGFMLDNSPIDGDYWKCVFADGVNPAIVINYPGVLFSTGPWFTLAVYGNKKRNVAYFKVMEQYTGGALDFDYINMANTWSVAIPLGAWPQKLEGMVHPAVSLAKTSGNAVTCDFWVDYVYLSKVLDGAR